MGKTESIKEKKLKQKMKTLSEVLVIGKAVRWCTMVGSLWWERFVLV